MILNILFKSHTAESTYANAKLSISTLIVLVNSNIIVFLNVSSYYYEVFIIYSTLPLQILCKMLSKMLLHLSQSRAMCVNFTDQMESDFLRDLNATSCAGSCIQIKIPLILGTESLLARYY